MHIRKCQDVYWDPKNEKSWLDREYGGGFQNFLSSSTFVLRMNPFQKSNIISRSSRSAGAEVEEKVSEYTSQLPLCYEVDKGKVWTPRSISPLPYRWGDWPKAPTLVLGQNRPQSPTRQSIPFAQIMVSHKMVQEAPCLTRELGTQVARKRPTETSRKGNVCLEVSKWQRSNRSHGQGWFYHSPDSWVTRTISEVFLRQVHLYRDLDRHSR